MRYASTIVYVPDTAAAVDFYGRAFGLEPGFSSPDASYATLGGDGSGLAFATHEMAPQAPSARRARRLRGLAGDRRRAGRLRPRRGGRGRERGGAHGEAVGPDRGRLPEGVAAPDSEGGESERRR